MTTVWKYELPIEDHVEIKMRGDAKILKCDIQKETLCIWALVETNNQEEVRRFRIAGTGHEIKDIFDMEYIGTFQMRGGELIFHVFEEL
jgi:hypothetical protein